MIETIKNILPQKVIRRVRNNLTRLQAIGRPKVFCIGRNKTGTTSIKKTVEELGLLVGNQSEAELLFENYLHRDFKPIIEFSKTAQFFQDIPFNLPYVYPVLDQSFPNSNFILSIRSSPEEWVNSFLRFQAKVNGRDGELPSKEALLENKRVFKGFPYWTKNDVYRTPDYDIYNKQLLIDHYVNYNKEVKHYFRFKENLIVLDISNDGAYQKFCDFLGVKPVHDSFLWENKTERK